MQRPRVRTIQPSPDESAQPHQRMQGMAPAPSAVMSQEVEGTTLKLIPGGADPSVPAAELAGLGITYIPPEVLCAHMEAGIQNNMVVVDLRTFDYPGGHIRGSLQVPAAGVVLRTDEVVSLLADYNTVIFHCMLSMHRAPQCAQIYKMRLIALGCHQHVAILEGGYSRWRTLYSGSPSLIEDETHDYAEAVRQHNLGLALGQQFIADLPKSSLLEL